MLSARELFPSRHYVVAGRPHEIPNQVELMGVALASNNGLSHKHFAKYTAVGGQLWATPSKKKKKDEKMGAAGAAFKSYPTPHTSMAVVYCLNWSSSSGGRYHRVTTRPV